LDATLVTGHSQILSGLLAGTTYHFRVRSADGSGALSVSGDNTFTTTSNPGPVISAIAASNITTSVATINWTTNVSANSQVEYGTTTAYGSLTTLDATLVTGHSQILSGLLAGTIYHFRVRSADGSGALSVSGDNTFTTTNPPPVISAITATNIGASSVTINWTTNVLANSQVESGTTTAYGSLSTLSATLVTGHSQTLSSLLAGTAYHFRVRSADGTGALSISGDNTFTTTLNTGPVISAITSASISNTGTTITWTTNISSTSQVEYGTTTAYGSSTSLDATLVTGHNLTFGGLRSGTIYHFRVDSADGLGNRSISSDYTFTTTGPTRPAAPALHSQKK
ncbi:MAG TPA: fibronectin type III domain-containing protein, partial [Nitrospiria bacterium]|nr:fibronectin type III domain-containing protein [Nitrospiria bacterium]